MEKPICSICIDSSFSDIETHESRLFKTSCGHIFHYSCLIKWVSINNSCPTCRKPNLLEEYIQPIPDNLYYTDNDDSTQLDLIINTFPFDTATYDYINAYYSNITVLFNNFFDTFDFSYQLLNNSEIEYNTEIVQPVVNYRMPVYARQNRYRHSMFPSNNGTFMANNQSRNNIVNNIRYRTNRSSNLRRMNFF